jgi:putative transposase
MFLTELSARTSIFCTDDDYLSPERAIAEALEKPPMRILGYCVMPNRWHFVL